MKTCNTCGKKEQDQASYCTTCGSTDFSAGNEAEVSVLPTEPSAGPEQGIPAEHMLDNGNGNVIAGIVGAFLFSILGGLLYFVVYQIGYVAGICGLVIFVLANFGYGLFAKSGNKNSTVGLIVSILITIGMIFAAQYICLSYEIFRVYKESNITIFDAIRVTPQFLKEPEISRSVIGDLAFAYIFGFVATIGNIVNMVKERKRMKKIA